MKKLLLLSFVLFSFSSFGQTPTYNETYKIYLTGNPRVDSVLINVARIKMKESGIERNVDEFTNEIQINTNILSPITLYKHINKGKPIVYYLRLDVSALSVSFDNSGVIILFTDGTRWVKPNVKISTEYDDGIKYKAFISINEKDVNLFATKKIKKYRLSVYDSGNINYDEFLSQCTSVKNSL
jgi:hypothetical protein